MLEISICSFVLKGYIWPIWPFSMGKLGLKTYFSNTEKTINVRLFFNTFWLYSHTNLSKQQELGTASHICKNEVNLPLESVTSTKDLKGVWSTLWHLKYSNACNIFCPNFPKDFVYLLKIQLIIFDTNFEIVARS